MAEIDRRIWSFASTSFCTTVDFPVPEGPDTTSNLPLLFILILIFLVDHTIGHSLGLNGG